MKKRTLLTSILSIAMCLSLAVGATFALFTDEAKVNVAVTSGTVDVKAEVTKYVSGSTLGEEFVQVTDNSDGTYDLSTMVAGDYVDFTVAITNHSDVSVNYRIATKVQGELANEMVVSITDENGVTLANNGYTQWAFITAAVEKIGTYTVNISIPENNTTANGGKQGNVSITVEAVQGNAPVANADGNGEIIVETTAKDANNNQATAPIGTKLEAGKNTLTLKIAQVNKTNTGNFSVDNAENVIAYDVKILEVSKDNEQAIKITMAVLPNLENVLMFHDGVAMYPVESADEVNAHNDFYYDATSGLITFATKNFSNFTIVDKFDFDRVVFVCTEVELNDALESNDGKEIIFKNDIKYSNTVSSGYGKTSIKVDGDVINGNGYKLISDGSAWGTWDSVIAITGGTVKNLTVSNAMRGIFMPGAKDNVVIENVIFDNVIYTFNSDAGSKDYTVTIKNSTINGWTSFSDVHKSVVFENCTFGEGNGYAFCRPYNADSKFINCQFSEGFEIDTTKTKAVFEKCTYAGVQLSELSDEQFKSLFYNYENQKHKVEIDGYIVVSSNVAFDSAIKAGETSIKLTSGAYIVPDSAKGKTLTIAGMGEVIIATQDDGSYEGCDYSLDGSTVTFENITINTDSKTYTGYARLNATYNNCTINGTYTLYSDSVFNGCTFNVSGDVYNIWTWGAPTASFKDCTFNSDGKAILLYGTENTELHIDGCTFNDNGGLSDLKAAIEIGNDYNKSYTLIVNNTIVNGYEVNDKGISTGTTLWGNKNSMSTEKLNVIVDGVDVY